MPTLPQMNPSSANHWPSISNSSLANRVRSYLQSQSKGEICLKAGILACQAANVGLLTAYRVTDERAKNSVYFTAGLAVTWTSLALGLGLLVLNGTQRRTAEQRQSQLGEQQV